MSCNHSQWVDIDGSYPRWTIVDHRRLQRLGGLLTDRQPPSVIFYLGRAHKTRFLRRAHGQTEFKPRGLHGIASVHVDNLPGTSGPFIIFNCQLGAQVQAVRELGHCHDSVRYGFRQDQSLRLPDLVLLLHARVLIPFCHLVCIFASDVGGNQATACLIKSWLLLVSSRRTKVPCQLLVVTTSMRDLDALIQAECHQKFHLLFDELTVLTIDPDLENSSRLESRISQLLEFAQRRRQECYLAFDGTTTVKVLDTAVREFSQNPDRAPSVLSLVHHPLSTDSVKPAVHLRESLDRCQRSDLPRGMTEDFIASVLIMQGYPAQVHACAPGVLYDCVFHPWLVEAAVPAANRSRIYMSFIRMVRSGGHRDAVDFRRKLLQRHQPIWGRLCSWTTCLTCGTRPAERMLECGHSMCETCPATFYEADRSPYTYAIDCCLLCGVVAGFILRCKPPTLEPCVLAIDGGGVRGIVSLQLLRRLQEAVGNVKLWKYFEYVIGTSVGGHICLDLVVMQHTVDNAIVHFLDAVPQIFPLLPVCCGFCHKVIVAVVSLIKDGKHDAAVLEDVLREQFGKHQRLFGGRVQREFGVKVAVTATTASECHLRLFTNYNGSCGRAENSGYSLLRRPLQAHEAFLWEIARCTAAAPGYFPPRTIGDLEELQDGGLRANNPTETGLSEVRRLWSTNRPRVVLSVGTGFAKAPTHELADRRKGYISRVIQSFLSSPCLHGQNSWSALFNRQPPETQGDFYRLNHEFCDVEPELDDSSCVDELSALVQATHVDVTRPRDAMWASRFYFELSELPLFSAGSYRCRGALRCHVDGLPKTITAAHPQAKVRLNHHIVCDLSDGRFTCLYCGIFRVEIALEVQRLDEPVELTLTTERGSQRISGFPNTMQWCIDQQSSEGRFRSWPIDCQCVDGRKRRRHTILREAKRLRTTGRISVVPQQRETRL